MRSLTCCCDIRPFEIGLVNSNTFARSVAKVFLLIAKVVTYYLSLSFRSMRKHLFHDLPSKNGVFFFAVVMAESLQRRGSGQHCCSEIGGSSDATAKATEQNGKVSAANSGKTIVDDDGSLKILHSEI